MSARLTSFGRNITRIVRSADPSAASRRYTLQGTDTRKVRAAARRRLSFFPSSEATIAQAQACRSVLGETFQTQRQTSCHAALLHRCSLKTNLPTRASLLTQARLQRTPWGGCGPWRDWMWRTGLQNGAARLASETAFGRLDGKIGLRVGKSLLGGSLAS